MGWGVDSVPGARRKATASLRGTVCSELLMLSRFDAGSQIVSAGPCLAAL